MNQRKVPSSLRRWAEAVLYWVLAGAMCLGALDANAATPWPESPFSYVSRQRTLEQVFRDFSTTFGLQLRMDDDLAGESLPASGRSQSATPTEFLNQLCAAHGLVWHHHAGVLHISRMSSNTTRAFTTQGLPPDTLKRVLGDLGLLDERFGWSGVPERATVFVSGPRTYVERLGEAIGTLPQASADQRVLVYRLQHAAVEDRTLRYRDTTITTPGVASILRALIGESAGQIGVAGGGATAGEPGDKADVPPSGAAGSDLRGAGRGQGKSGVPAPSDLSRNGAKAATGKSGPSIQSDVRLNAIIVRDSPVNEPVYRQLIEALDVPSSLVEIEAMIIDVNTSNLAELGIDWRSSRGTLSGSYGTPDAASDGATLRFASSGVLDLMARIRLLEGKGGARIVSRPSILTQDNMGALIDLSDTFYIQSVGERVADVTPVSVGISLRVVPRIVDEPQGRAIHLVVDIEDGAIQEIQVGKLPTVRRSSIGTQAMVGENKTLVIGGFNAERSLRQRDQVPVLGSVPGVGLFFGKTTEREQKLERLFLITPRVVSLHEAGRERDPQTPAGTQPASNAPRTP